MITEDNSPAKIIGKGRSGQVYRKLDADGNDLAVKVFSGVDGLTNLVNYVLTGAPNAYAWNHDAVECAHYRREILNILIPFWFGSGIRIAKSFGAGWHKHEKAFMISTEFITGRPVALNHPFSKKTDKELSTLVTTVMQPLEKHLIESGFDGLVWQAGKGNPIALNNFLLDKNGDWVWIDAESGVPALFPLNPLSLFLFYIPKSFKHGRPLFDDTDTVKLKIYLESQRDNLENKIGKESLEKLIEYTHKHEHHQRRWKSLKRIQKSILYQLSKNRISQEQADWYSNHQLQWLSKEFGRLLKRAFIKVFYKLPLKVIKTLASIKYWTILKNTFRFIFIGKYRKASVEELIKSRIAEWEDRGHLKTKHADYFRDQAEHESTSPYLADFIILIGLKPLTNVIELVVLPALYAAGVINEAALAIGVTLGGVIYRTIYTLGKMIYEKVLPVEEHPRWIALIIGLIPTFGNLAYPTQMVYSASSKSKELAEFLMYDISARIGAKIPIWGGKDTRTEHFFNRLPNSIIRRIKFKEAIRARKRKVS